MNRTIQIQKPKYHEYAEALRNTECKQIKYQRSDNRDGRCAIGALMGYEGWDGRHDTDMDRKEELRYVIKVGQALSLDVYTNVFAKNDAGWTFNEIADWLDTL